MRTHLTLIKSPAPPHSGRLSLAEHQSLRTVLWGWLSLASRQPLTTPTTDRRGVVLESAVHSIDRGSWLQDVAILPPMVLSAVRTAALLAHLPDGSRLLNRWLLLNQDSLFTNPSTDTCRDILRLNTTLEGVSGFDDDELEPIAAIAGAMIRFHWNRLR